MVMRWMLLALVMTGCTTATAVMGPDGTPHYDVYCPRGMVACYQKMAEVCPTGYELVHATSAVSTTPTPNGPVTGTSQDVLIKCRQATAALGR